MMTFPDKVRIWELFYLQDMPIDTIRGNIRPKVKKNGVVPSWTTVKQVVEDFPLLTHAQALELPVPLQMRWRELHKEEPQLSIEKEKSAEQKSKLDDSVAPELYQEHQNGMLQFVERFRLEISFGPRLCLFQLRNLGGPGSHSETVLFSGTTVLLFWQVKDYGSVSLNYAWELPEDAETKIIWNYLQQHLRSSSYTWLLEDNEKGIKKWKRLGGEELKRRTGLLCRLDRKIEKLTHKPLSNPSHMNYPGPSYWFSISIWNQVLDRLYDYLDYKIEPNNNGLYKALYGIHFIGLTTTKEECEQYVEWHKSLRADCEKSSAVKVINKLKNERLLAQKDIENAFTKFLVDKHIPGRCNYEFCH